MSQKNRSGGHLGVRGGNNKQWGKKGLSTFNSPTCILVKATSQFFFSNYSNTFHNIFVRLCLLHSFSICHI